MSLLKIEIFDRNVRTDWSNDTEWNKSRKKMKSTSDTERNYKRNYRLGIIITVQDSFEKLVEISAQINL